MSSRVPRQDASKKRDQLARSKEALVRVIRANESHEKKLGAVEEYRTAYLSFLKAKLHWANEALVVGAAGLGRRAGNLRAKAASVTAQSDMERLESEIAAWSGKPAEEVLHESGVA